MGFLNGVIKALGLDPNDRAVAKYEKKTEIIDSLEPEVEKLSDEELARSAEISSKRARASTTYCPRFSRASARSRSARSACATSRNS